MNTAVSYKWNVDEQAPVTQLESGRRLTVIPREVEVWAGGGRKLGVLTVCLRGRRLNLDGTRGSVKGAVFTDDADERWYGVGMDQLPAWARPYVEQARAWEAARASVGGA